MYTYIGIEELSEETARNMTIAKTLTDREMMSDELYLGYVMMMGYNLVINKAYKGNLV